MIDIALRIDIPSQRPLSPATVSARAINAAPTRTNEDGMLNRDCLHSQNLAPSLIKDSRRLARLAVYFPTTRLATIRLTTTRLTTTRLPTKGLFRV